MFEAKIYSNRRNQLKKQVKSGVLLFLGNDESPMNYPDNAYTFRQDSSFLYYWGLESPGLAAVIDLDENREILFGYDFTVDDTVWMGPQPSLTDRAALAGVKEAKPSTKLDEYIRGAIKSGRRVHFLPPYRAENRLRLSKLTGIRPDTLNHYVSEELIRAVVGQRSVKADEETEQIEKAHDIAYQMQTTAMKMTRPGLYERDIVGAMTGIANAMGSGISFPVIFSIHGETLHNHHHENKMSDGNLVVNDSGAESILHYASDITRTFPVNGKFSERQKEIYSIVLNAQMSAIDAIRPGVLYRDVHLMAAKVIAGGLKDLGLMKGDTDEAVKNGAHALFFPHGLGHMMGLDVHDMEDLGENYVGYDESVTRSKQFGLAYLRLAKKLIAGNVLTVEPGIYFIPELIRQWKAEKKLVKFLNYDKIESYIGFGGIRIEDDVLVTESGRRVFGKPIPKTIDEVEAAVSKK
ncbi:MAG: aminopeptidase P family protein [Calditrichaceae bacterium]